MPIRIVTKTTIICDICGTQVIGNYVDATSYGRVFHPLCWEGVAGGPDVAQCLDLEDIKICDANRLPIDGTRYGKRRP